MASRPAPRQEEAGDGDSEDIHGAQPCVWRDVDQRVNHVGEHSELDVTWLWGSGTVVCWGPGEGKALALPRHRGVCENAPPRGHTRGPQTHPGHHTNGKPGEPPERQCRTGPGLSPGSLLTSPTALTRMSVSSPVKRRRCHLLIGYIFGVYLCVHSFHGCPLSTCYARGLWREVGSQQWSTRSRKGVSGGITRLGASASPPGVRLPRPDTGGDGNQQTAIGHVPGALPLPPAWRWW